METRPDKPSASSPGICLFGGTFDPIHLGHTTIAQAAVREFDLDQILFLPCRQSPHKIGQDHASAKHRLEMCQLAIQDMEWAKVDDHDLTSPPPSYSWLTAQAMYERFPGARLYWLMGTDQWKALPQWTHPDKLASLVEFIVYSRGEHPVPRDGYRMHAIHGEHPASATEIRQAPDTLPASEWLHPTVLEYIQTHDLYHTSTSVDEADG